jgi:hypothetical protein
LCLLSQPVFSQCSVFQILVDKESIYAPDILRFQLLNPVADSSYEQTRNGIYKGDQCQQGTYMYTLIATEINKKKVYLKGSVTLLR